MGAETELLKMEIKGCKLMILIKKFIQKNGGKLPEFFGDVYLRLPSFQQITNCWRCFLLISCDKWLVHSCH